MPADAPAPWISALDTSPAVADHRVVDLPASQAPWVDTGLAVRQGEQVTVIRHGRVMLVEPDLWLDAGFNVWLRVGGRGPIQRGSRRTHTFVVSHDGNIELGNVTPAEWADTDGAISVDPTTYEFVTGASRVVVVRWAPGTDVVAILREMAANGDVIECSTRGNAGIICHEVNVELTPDTTVSWSWMVDQLPSAVAEDTFATHDYMSVAVEFDDGKDLTWYWSAGLPSGHHFRCPLPHWDGRETHLVIRSGTSELGQWVAESRNALADHYLAIGGGAPRRIVRLWLIAVSLMQRQEGRCKYRNFLIADGDGTRVEFG